MVFDTDVKMAPKVYMSLQMYRDKEVRELVKRVTPAIRALMLSAGTKKTPEIRLCSLSIDEGFCESDGLEISVCVKKMRTAKDILETVAHELVHAGQFQSKRLVMTGFGDFWEGKYRPVKDTYAGYRRAPWEVEAFRLQKPLAKKVMQKYNIVK